MSDINISASRFNSLKARLKQVLKNRKYYGDVSKLGGDTYDFNISPTTGDILLSDQGAKVINLILNINDIGAIKNIENNNYILQDISSIENFVTKLEAQTSDSAANLCRGGCMGICVTHCSTLCIGSCLTSCTSDCASKCTNTCIQTCQGSCSGGCSGASCRADCQSDCMGGAKVSTRR